MSRNGSTIKIDCKFVKTYPEASCVLVYRKYDNLLLTVVDIPQLFPITLTVDNHESYTFALFGKDDTIGMEEYPVITAKFKTIITNLTTGNYCSITKAQTIIIGNEGKTESNQDKTNSSQRRIVAITIGRMTN